MRMDGWDELGYATPVTSFGCECSGFIIFVKDGYYVAIEPNVLDIDEKKPSKYKYPVQTGSFRIDGERYNGRISFGPDNDRYFKF